MEGGNIPRQRQDMLTSILDLEKVTVDDIMVPRSDVVGVDLEDKWPEIIDLIRSSPYTRLPVFNGELDQLIGVLHMRKLVNRLAEGELTREILNDLLDEPYFVPEGTPLNKQLLYFQQARQRFALVVDEYGDIQGLITMADLLEEIVGEFTSDPDHMTKDIHAETDDCYVVNGAINIRELNRIMNWHLPTDGPKTLNGLILEYLETIPEPGTGLKLADYPIEVLHTSENAVKTVRIHARREQKQAS
jgi:Mg2+/Co2+ transporter CorB